MTKKTALSIALASLLLAACATAPTGPSVLVLPGDGKSFDQFRLDDMDCRAYAQNQLGTTAEQAGMDSGAKSAAIGAAVGTGAGILIGGSRGAAPGAGVGLAVGALSGTGYADQSTHGAQRRYDMGYQQCMYAKGHKVPVAGRLEGPGNRRAAPSAPPPPPGTPPPPPPK